jgi:hypothetical protein
MERDIPPARDRGGGGRSLKERFAYRFGVYILYGVDQFLVQDGIVLMATCFSAQDANRTHARQIPFGSICMPFFFMEYDESAS